MKWFYRLITFVVLFNLSPLHARDLMSVYQLALQQDPQLRAAEQQLYAAREGKNISRSQLLPTIGVGAGATAIHSDIKTRMGQSVDDTQDYNDTNLGLNLVLPIYRRDYWMQFDQADSVIAQAEAQYEGARIDLMVRTVTAYFGILAALDDQRVAEAQKEATGRQLEQAQQRFDVGLIAITDVHEAQAAYDAARAEVIAAENSVDNAWEALFEIIGPETKSKLSLLGDDLTLNPPSPNDMQSWSDTAQQNNYDVIATMARLESLRQEVEVSRSGHYPSLDLVGGYNVNRTTNDFGTEADTGSIGLELSVPLYTGGGVSSRTEQARANYRAAQEELDQVRRAVNRQVRDSYRGVLSTISRVEALKAATISANSALESTQAGYEVGTRTIVDVLNVQRNLFSSQRDYYASRYDYVLNALALKSAAGTLAEEDLERVNNWLNR